MPPRALQGNQVSGFLWQRRARKLRALNSGESAGVKPFSYYIGWCVLAAAITQLPMMVGGILAFPYSQKIGLLLLGLSTPVVALLLAGGLGLIWQRSFGFYCVYAATFFGGIGGLKVSYLPFVQGLLKIGPHTEDVFLGLNLLIVGLLAWEHFIRLWELAPGREQAHRLVLTVVLALGLCSVGFGRAMINHERGEAVSIGAVPFAGPLLASLKLDGSVRFVAVHTKLQNGITLSFSGKISEASLADFAQANSLKAVDTPEAQAKMLPQTRRWRLKPEQFPVEFAPSDEWRFGRLKDAPKSLFQIVRKKSDGSFTAELFGVISPP